MRHSAAKCARVSLAPAPAAAARQPPQKHRLRRLRDRRRRGHAAHAEVEVEDEQRRQRHVDDVGRDRRHHGRARVALAIAHLAQRAEHQRHRRRQVADVQVGARRLARRCRRRHRGQQLRHALPDRDHHQARAQGRQHCRGAIGVDQVAPPGAHRLRHQRLYAAQKAEPEGEKRECGGAAEADAGERRRAEVADHQRVDQGHDAVREHRHANRPRQPQKLSERSSLPRKVEAGCVVGCRGAHCGGGGRDER